MPRSDLHEAVWEAVPEGGQPPLANLRLAYLLEHLTPGRRVLDLGCGEGWFAQQLAQRGMQVVGADVAGEPLRRARAHHPGLRLELITQGEQWPFAVAEFDAVWAGEVIEHVADTAAWLSELRRVLAPEGTLLLSTPAHGLLRRLGLALLPGAFEAHFDPRGDHLRFYTVSSLRALLHDFRFEEVRIDRAGGIPGVRACLLACARRARF
jgi:2-polyprenyl-3-methyl-5-hydroxy-6-metoxy-1,4-benzoquinol methylase